MLPLTKKNMPKKKKHSIKIYNEMLNEVRKYGFGTDYIPPNKNYRTIMNFKGLYINFIYDVYAESEFFNRLEQEGFRINPNLLSSKHFVKLTSILPDVMATIEMQGGNAHTPFNLTLSSYQNPKWKYHKLFNTIGHLQNWISKIEEIEQFGYTHDGYNFGNELLKHDELPDGEIISSLANAFDFVDFDAHVIKGGCAKEGDNSQVRIFGKVRLTYTSVNTRRNGDCAYEVITRLLKIPREKQHIAKMKKKVGLKNEENGVDMITFQTIYQHFGGTRELFFIDFEKFNPKEPFDYNPESFEYVAIYKLKDKFYHYGIVTDIQNVEKKKKIVENDEDEIIKRGTIAWDVETRKTEKYVNINYTDGSGVLQTRPSSIIEETILCGYVWKYGNLTQHYIDENMNDNIKAEMIKEYLAIIHIEDVHPSKMEWIGSSIFNTMDNKERAFNLFFEWMFPIGFDECDIDKWTDFWHRISNPHKKPNREASIISISIIARDWDKEKTSKITRKYFTWKVYEEIVFLTEIHEGGRTASRQFLDFLKDERVQKRYYNCVGHNAANFDNYFLLGNMTPEEIALPDTSISLRGKGLIGMTIFGNNFRDSACHLTGSLDTLCKDFKVRVPKLKELQYKGVKMTNLEFLFIYPEMTFNEYMTMIYNDEEYRTQLKNYCMVDCIGLAQVWDMYKVNVDQLIESFNPAVKKYCSVTSKLTIGSLGKEMLLRDNAKNPVFLHYLKFIGYKDKITDPLGDLVMKKYFYKAGFVRGGMCIVGQAGKHIEGLTTPDMRSQYPIASLSSKIPAGNSRFLTVEELLRGYKKDEHVGYFHVRNLVFTSDESIKPIPKFQEDKGESLQWKTGMFIKEAKLTSFLIDYLVEHYGLDVSKMELVCGLISSESIYENRFVYCSDITGKFLNAVYAIKAQQDYYKGLPETHPDRCLYNPSLRSTAKMLLVAPLGKCNERTDRYTKCKFDGVFDNEGETENYKTFKSEKINGVNLNFTKDAQINRLMGLGIATYEYSKMIFCDYIRMIGSENIVFIQTDSMTFATSLLGKLKDGIKDYEGEFKCIEIGDKMGNLEIEFQTSPVLPSYSLEKGTYYLQTIVKNSEPKYVNEIRRITGLDVEFGFQHKTKTAIIGFPSSTIDKNGSKVQLVTVETYEKLYNGEVQYITSNTLKKDLFGNDRPTITNKEVTKILKRGDAYKKQGYKKWTEEMVPKS